MIKFKELYQTLRNALQWLWALFWMVSVLLVTICVYPFIVLFAVWGTWRTLRHESNARVTDTGIEVFSKKKGLIATCKWNEIASLVICRAPKPYPELILASGERMPLVLANIDLLAKAMTAHGIAVVEQQ